MLDRIAEYRERAAYCRERADDAPREDLKVGWLDLAGKWLEMAGLRTSDGSHFNEPIPKTKPAPDPAQTGSPSALASSD